MKYNHRARKVAAKVPVAKKYIELRDLRRQAVEQGQLIKEQEQAIKRLEARNDEWAAEVRAMRGEAKALKIVWPAFEEDVIAADWRHKSTVKPAKAKPPFTINWVVPPMGSVSGGHVDIFRAIQFLESKGHKCRIYYYDARETPTFEQVKETMKEYPKVEAELFYNHSSMLPCDIIFATSWQTAYPVFNYSHAAHKAYFVQDFEPMFEPSGTYSTLAENTYRFGFHGITLGRWLATKLSKEYGMKCDYLSFGVDLKEYKLENKGARKKILFYARPVSPRRGFELGVLALQEFYNRHPEYEINFVGWDITPYDVPFPYVNNGKLSGPELNRLYNDCAAGLVLSFSNMSLLPLEMMASGCAPVVNDAEYTRMVSYKDSVKFTEPAPMAIAENLYQVAESNQQSQLAPKLAKAAATCGWQKSNQKLEATLIKLAS